MLLSGRMSSAATERIFAVVLALLCCASTSLLFAQQPAQTPTPPSGRGVMRKLLPIDQQGTIPYFIADGIERSGHRPSDTELVVWAFEEWERAAKNIHFTRSENEGLSLVRLYWVPPARGHAGITYAMTANRRPAANVFVSAAMRQFPKLEASANSDSLLRDVIVYFLSLHEIGHALGILGHTTNPDDVMHVGGRENVLFPQLRKRVTTRESIHRLEWLSVTDKKLAAALYAQ
jgi:hypothetical protein